MRKHKSKIVKELDPQEVEGYSKARIEHYLSLGYRPYLNDEGHIKWLTQAQMSLRSTGGGGGLSLKKLLRPKKSRYYKHRRRRSHWRSFVKENILMIILSLMAIVAVLLLVIYPYLIF